MRKPVIIKEDIYQLVEAEARKENRTTTNMVDTILRDYFEQDSSNTVSNTVSDTVSDTAGLSRLELLSTKKPLIKKCLHGWDLGTCMDKRKDRRCIL